MNVQVLGPRVGEQQTDASLELRSGGKASDLPADFRTSGFQRVWRSLEGVAMKKTRHSNSRGRTTLCLSNNSRQFRDLRRKSASDEEDEQTAQQRLGHASVAITNRVYRVLPKKVKPLR